MEYVVYQIRANDKIVYIGKTSDIDRREKEHNSGFLKTQVKKQLYEHLHNIGYKDKIILEPIYLTNNKLLAKQYECYMYLYLKFNTDVILQQKAPIIKDF